MPHLTLQRSKPALAPTVNRTAVHSGRILITPGEPAGVGPELLLQVAGQPRGVELVAIADADLLTQRAQALGLKLRLNRLESATDSGDAHAHLQVLHCPLRAPVIAGQPSPDNAAYVLQTLDMAREALLAGHADALCTGPIQKSAINDAGITFSGHTEYLAKGLGDALPVMMLAGPSLRVALVTTHLPLRAVPDSISTGLVRRVIDIVHTSMQARFGMAKPRLCVTGLNPHAGEAGHLGLEDAAVIAPAVQSAVADGLDVYGPVPADTAFHAQARATTDAFIAMYHDQGLAVVKALDFGQVVNITLGLPFVRTSVDHGTALDLAGTGRADPQSLNAAIAQAIQMAGLAKQAA